MSDRLMDTLRENHDLRNQLAGCQATLTLQRDIVTDLMLDVGMADRCAKCGSAAFWLRHSSTGAAVLYNIDGSQHWPRCPGTTRPKGGAA